MKSVVPAQRASITTVLSLGLRAIVLVQCVGLVWTSRVAGTEIETILFGEYGWPDRFSFLLDRTIAGALLAVAVVGLVLPMRAGYVTMAAWFVAMPLARWSFGGVPFHELALPADAIRWVAPLAIALLPACSFRQASAALPCEAPSREVPVTWLLRAAVAATFFTHGIEALQGHPGFVDYLLIADRRLLEVGLDQSGAELLLRVIGVVDIACALALLALPLRRGLLAYMAFWGLLTAGARIVHSGEHGIHEALVRVANGGVPALLWLLGARLPRAARSSLAVSDAVDWLRTRSSGGRWIAVLALMLSVTFSMVHHGASGQDAALAPRQLRLIWAEDPSHHARLSWTTTSAGVVSAVHYDTVPRDGVVAAYAHRVTTSRDGEYASGTPYYHHVELDDLLPSTTYWFVVETDGNRSDELHFVTAPADDRPFTLLYGGDSRSSSTNRRRMNQTMARLFEEREGIIGLGHGGDFVNTGADWLQWDEWLEDHQLTITDAGRMLPVIPTRGNHEPDREMYNRVFGWPGGEAVDYFVTHLGANTTLITLDSNVSHGGDQRVWLEAQLEAAQSRRWIVPGYHRPAFPAVKTPGPALEHWVPLFEAYEVDLVCESDGHVLKRTVPIREGLEAADGIVYVGEGGLGVSQRTPMDFWYLDAPGMSVAAHHVQLLSFSPETLRYEAIAMDGTTLDSYVAHPRREGAVVTPIEPVPDAGVPPDHDAGMEPSDVGSGDVPDAGSGGSQDAGAEGTPPPPFGRIRGGCAVARAGSAGSAGSGSSAAALVLVVLALGMRRRQRVVERARRPADLPREVLRYPVAAQSQRGWLAATLAISSIWACGDDSLAPDDAAAGPLDGAVRDATMPPADSGECTEGQVVCDDRCCDPATAIALPVEVLGAEGTIAQRTFDLEASEASAVAYLWMQVNNLSYQDKGSVRVNEGAWIDLNHDTVEMHGPERARGGMVHGGYSTIRFRLPLEGFVAGENRVEFRFNRSDGISMGFRVVRFQLLDAAGADILPTYRFYHDDPTGWEPPLSDEASIAEGEELWRSAGLWSHYLEPGRTGSWYAATIPEARPIRAACADCHTQDGRDLEIFAYSNESIIERARFHQLSEEEGQKIASYIRSLSARHDDVGRWGRPWNPPYQPGSRVADRPVQEWAAGAGLEAVLEEDRDMLGAMFPDGVSEEAVAAYFDSGAMEDHTTLPIAVQLPDWKHWLPLVHPMDAYANDGFYEDDSVEFNPTRAYAEVRRFFEEMPASERSAAELLRAINRHWRHYRLFLAQGSRNARHWRTRDGSATTRGLVDSSVPGMEIAATSLGRLLAVKHFELMNEFGLQAEARRLFDPADQPIARQWLGRDYQVFELPPHFTACFDDDAECEHFQGQPIETGQFESTQWYHLQLVLNGGQGQMLHNSPVDNNYHPEFILKASRSSGLFEPLRYYSSINAMYQTRTWTGATNPNDGRGFRIRIQGPWYFLAKEGDAQRNHFHGFDPGFFPSLLDDVSPGLTKWILDALFQQFVREVQRPENSLDGWVRFNEGGDASNNLDPVDKSSVVDVTQRGSATLNRGGPLWADHTYWSIRQAADMGGDCGVLGEAIDWAQAAWPLIDFEAHRGRFTAYVRLRQDAGGVTAILGNEGDAPTLEWTVDGSPVGATGAVLPASAYGRGDEIGVRLVSDAACLRDGRRSATANLTAE